MITWDSEARRPSSVPEGLRDAQRGFQSSARGRRGPIPTPFIRISYELVVSEHLLSELKRALANRYFAARVPAERATRILQLLRTDARLTDLTVPVAGVATQPEDDLVLATALSGGASYLATRDKQLLKLGGYRGLDILHPVDLLDLLISASTPS